MRMKPMTRFWKIKRNLYFKQGTALIVAWSLFCSMTLPPFADARSLERFQVRNLSRYQAKAPPDFFKKFINSFKIATPVGNQTDQAIERVDTLLNGNEETPSKKLVFSSLKWWAWAAWPITITVVAILSLRDGPFWVTHLWDSLKHPEIMWEAIRWEYFSPNAFTPKSVFGSGLIFLAILLPAEAAPLTGVSAPLFPWFSHLQMWSAGLLQLDQFILLCAAGILVSIVAYGAHKIVIMVYGFLRDSWIVVKKKPVRLSDEEHHALIWDSRALSQQTVTEEFFGMKYSYRFITYIHGGFIHHFLRRRNIVAGSYQFTNRTSGQNYILAENFRNYPKMIEQRKLLENLWKEKLSTENIKENISREEAALAIAYGHQAAVRSWKSIQDSEHLRYAIECLTLGQLDTLLHFDWESHKKLRAQYLPLLVDPASIVTAEKFMDSLREYAKMVYEQKKQSQDKPQPPSRSKKKLFKHVTFKSLLLGLLGLGLLALPAEAVTLSGEIGQWWICLSNSLSHWFSYFHTYPNDLTPIPKTDWSNMPLLAGMLGAFRLSQKSLDESAKDFYKTLMKALVEKVRLASGLFLNRAGNRGKLLARNYISTIEANDSALHIALFSYFLSKEPVNRSNPEEMEEIDEEVSNLKEGFLWTDYLHMLISTYIYKELEKIEKAGGHPRFILSKLFAKLQGEGHEEILSAFSKTIKTPAESLDSVWREEVLPLLLNYYEKQVKQTANNLFRDIKITQMDFSSEEALPIDFKYLKTELWMRVAFYSYRSAYLQSSGIETLPLVKAILEFDQNNAYAHRLPQTSKDPLTLDIFQTFQDVLLIEFQNRLPIEFSEMIPTSTEHEERTLFKILESNMMDSYVSIVRGANKESQTLREEITKDSVINADAEFINRLTSLAVAHSFTSQYLYERIIDLKFEYEEDLISILKEIKNEMISEDRVTRAQQYFEEGAAINPRTWDDATIERQIALDLDSFVGQIDILLQQTNYPLDTALLKFMVELWTTCNFFAERTLFLAPYFRNSELGALSNQALQQYEEYLSHVFVSEEPSTIRKKVRDVTDKEWDLLVKIMELTIKSGRTAIEIREATRTPNDKVMSSSNINRIINKKERPYRHIYNRLIDALDSLSKKPLPEKKIKRGTKRKGELVSNAQHQQAMKMFEELDKKHPLALRPMGEVLGISHQAIKNYKSGRREMTLITFYRLKVLYDGLVNKIPDPFDPLNKIKEVFLEKSQKFRKVTRKHVFPYFLLRMFQYMAQDQTVSLLNTFGAPTTGLEDWKQEQFELLTQKLFEMGGSLEAMKSPERLPKELLYSSIREKAALMFTNAQIVLEKEESDEFWEHGRSWALVLKDQPLKNIRDILESVLAAKDQPPVVNLFDVTEISEAQINMLYTVIQSSLVSDRKVYIPLLIRKDTFDPNLVEKLKERLIHRKGSKITPEMLEKVSFGEHIITSAELALASKQSGIDPNIEMNPDAIYDLLQDKIGGGIHLQIFTDNLYRFKEDWRTKSLDMLLIVSATQVLHFSQEMLNSLRSQELLSHNQ